MARRSALLVELDQVDDAMKDVNSKTELYKRLQKRKSEIEARLSTELSPIKPSCGEIKPAV